MSIGGHSLHRDDYLKLGALAAATATGFGAAGMGPLAGLLGPAGAAEGLAMGMGAAPGEAMGAFTGAASAMPGTGLLAGGGKTLDALLKARQLMMLASGGTQPMGMPDIPKRRKQPSGTGLDYLQQIYPTG